MHIKVTKSMFIDAFKAMRPENFSYDALSAMFDYFDDFSSAENDVELDVIAICCEYAEYDSIEDYNHQHETEFESSDELEQHCTVIEIDDNRFVAGEF